MFLSIIRINVNERKIQGIKRVDKETGPSLKR